MLERLRQSIFQNLGIKVTSLVLALAVYAHVFSKEERIMVLSCPIVIEDLPPGLAFAGEVPSDVRVKVRARGGDLVRFRGQTPLVVVRLKDARPGLLQRPLTAEDVVFPSGFRAQVEGMMDRTTLSLDIERTRKKTLPIVPTLAGELEAGVAISGRIHVIPDTLTVRGPESLLKGLDSLHTEEISLDGRSNSLEEQVEVRVPRGLRPGQASTRVRIDLVRRGS